MTKAAATTGTTTAHILYCKLDVATVSVRYCCFRFWRPWVWVSSRRLVTTYFFLFDKTSEENAKTVSSHKDRYSFIPYFIQLAIQRSSYHRKLIKDNYMGRAIAQAVSRRLPTAAAARVQTRIWSCVIFWWTKVALGQVFSENFGFPCTIYIPSASPQSSSLSPEAGTIGQEWPQCQ
jgi:hypothetical protein